MYVFLDEENILDDLVKIVDKSSSERRAVQSSSQKICPDCLLEFSATAISESEIRAGEPFVFYCPRCGSSMD